jgi:two-component system response regulator HydG
MNAGARVDLACNGKEALTEVTTRKFDIVVCDVRMPETSGIWFLEQIRELDQEVPQIIMMSAFTDLTEQSARELGAVGLIMKPKAIREMVEVIEDLVA